MKTKPLGAFGATVLIVMVFVAASANVLAPFDPVEMHYSDTLRAPSAKYLLGTDNFGRDVLSRIIYGARISLYIGLGAVISGTLLATALGVFSGYFGGIVDLLIQRVVDAFMAIPGLVLLLAMMSVLEPGVMNLIYALAIRLAFANTRIVRSAVVSVRQNQYVESARAIGTQTWRILLFHIFPNVTAPIIVVATISLGGTIFAEASLSFLGFGIPPPTPTWGSMLSRTGISYMIIAPWTAIAPGLVLSVAIFCINMFGDALRDILDPRLRIRQGK